MKKKPRTEYKYGKSQKKTQNLDQEIYFIPIWVSEGCGLLFPGKAGVGMVCLST